MNLKKLEKYFSERNLKVTKNKTDSNLIDWELTLTSDLGEEIPLLLTCNADIDSVGDRLYDIWYEFDKEEHASEIFENQKNSYYDGKKVYEVASLKELLLDAEKIKDVLSQLVDEYNADCMIFEEGNEDKNYEKY